MKTPNRANKKNHEAFLPINPFLLMKFEKKSLSKKKHNKVTFLNKITNLNKIMKISPVAL
jgi:hypothetical protein